MKIYSRVIVAFMMIVLISSCNKDDDNTKPWIVLKGYNPAYAQLNEPYVDSGAMAFDLNDYGDTIDISSKIVVENNVNTADTGKYYVKYNVEDEAGNKADEVFRTVYVRIF